MKNIKLTIEYCGSKYSGWQTQKNGKTIQETINKALFDLTGEIIIINGSGRTDAGVHAFGQVGSFKTISSIPPEKFSYALNQKLPSDIVIVKSEEVSMDFHARYSVKSKEYIYKIYCSEFPSAIYRGLVFQTSKDLNLDLMNNGCKYLLGIHDFKTFMSTGSDVKSTVREIFNAKCSKENNIITFTISGNGFLYNMVRIIVGTLIDIGDGKINAEEMQHIIESKDRNKASITSPACGLYLNRVYY